MSNSLFIKNNNLKASKRKLPHWELNGSIYHITFVTWDRLELNEAARQLVLDACLFFNFKRYEVFAVVVMHDHVHLLIKPWEKRETDSSDAYPAEYWSISSIMHSIKSYTSKQIPKVMRHIGTVWAQESYDHIIRDEEEFKDTWEYIRQNPVKAGLSASPEEYPYLWESNQEKCNF
jgi:putative transposase